MKKALILFFSLFAFAAYAQQEQQYTQYMVNPYVINPAVGGTEDFSHLMLGYRNQWVGFGRDNSGPKTYYASMHTTLGKQFRQYHHKGEHGYWHGIGGYIYRDQAGPTTRTTFYGNYSFNMPITSYIRLSAGVFAGIKQLSVDKEWFNSIDRPGYEDDYLLASNLNKTTPDVTAGLWMYSKDWYAGVSAFQLLQNQTISDDGITTVGDQGSGKLNTHIFLTAGFRLPMTEMINLVPSLAMKGVYPTPLSMDFNLKMDYNDLWFVGVNWRVQDSFSPIVGVTIQKRYEVSYSYDATTTKDLRGEQSGSHEVILGLRIGHAKNIDCPSKFW